MAITVGLDFGTHQTKVCIENSDDALHRTYEFWDWDEYGYALPSIIQINKDHTLRFGSYDEETCLVGQMLKSIPLPKEPNLPPEPKKPSSLSNIDEYPTCQIKDDEGRIITVKLTDMYGIGKKMPTRQKSEFPEYREWQRVWSSVKAEYEQRLKNWRILSGKFGTKVCAEPKKPSIPEEPYLAGYDYGFKPWLVAKDKHKKLYEKWLDNQNKQKKTFEAIEYNKRRAEWEKECQNRLNSYNRIKEIYDQSLEEHPMVFRYFKQATFSSYPWNYQISPSQLTVLYLSYLIFHLEKRYGNNYTIQMGIPASEKTFGRLKQLAVGHLIQAIRLVEDVFSNDLERFLNTPYEDLLNIIPRYEYSDNLKYEYGIMVLPEAYASLRSLTANGRIPRRMCIILDIGGGTTDISFFLIENNGEPHIYHYESIAKGLNFFLEYGKSSNDFVHKRELGDLSKEEFGKALKDYFIGLEKIVRKLTSFLHADTISRGFSKSTFANAIAENPIIYSGGGSYDVRIRRPILPFSDVIHVEKEILNIPNVVKESQIQIPYSVLATSFGLSITIDDDNVNVSSKEELFAKYSKQNNEGWHAHQEYGLADT